MTNKQPNAKGEAQGVFTPPSTPADPVLSETLEKAANVHVHRDDLMSAFEEMRAENRIRR